MGVPGHHIVAPRDGNTVAIKSTSQAWITRSFVARASPVWAMITPPDLGSFQVKQVLFDPFSPPNGALGCYILASDGTNSAVWYTADVLAGPPVWAKGTDITGVFSVLRAGKSSGCVMEYSVNAAGVTDPQSLAVTFDSGGYPYTLISGALVSGGNPGNCIHDGPGDPAIVEITVALPVVATVTAVRLDTKGTGGGASGWQITLKDAGGGTLATYSGSTSLDGVWRTVGSGAVSIANVARIDYLTSACSHGDCSPGAGSFEKWMDNCLCDFSFITTSGAQVAISFDGGRSHGAVTVGSTPGTVGGFDVQAAGQNSFAAVSGAVNRATTLGGAYSSYYAVTGGVQAACIIVPYFKWGGGDNRAATNPDIIVGLTGADGSSRTLLWVEGGATPGTVHDLTPVANYIFDSPNAVTVDYNHHIAVFGKVTGTYTVRTSVDKGSAWNNRGTLTAPGFIRGRRHDITPGLGTSGTQVGQLYLAQNNIVDYSRKWFSDALNARTMPATGVDGLDTW